MQATERILLQGFEGKRPASCCFFWLSGTCIALGSSAQGGKPPPCVVLQGFQVDSRRLA